MCAHHHAKFHFPTKNSLSHTHTHTHTHERERENEKKLSKKRTRQVIRVMDERSCSCPSPLIHLSRHQSTGVCVCVRGRNLRVRGAAEKKEGTKIAFLSSSSTHTLIFSSHHSKKKEKRKNFLFGWDRQATHKRALAMTLSSRKAKFLLLQYFCVSLYVLKRIDI
jgi:hypothetical protein